MPPAERAYAAVKESTPTSDQRERPNKKWRATVLIALALASAAWGQLGRDFLTAAEANQVQDTAGHLDRRIPLLTGFAQQRLENFEALRATPPGSAGREEGLHRDLDQFGKIVGELDDNLADLMDNVTTSETPTAKIDKTKLLNTLISAENALHEQLQRIQRESSAADLETYHFALDDSTDALNDSLKNAQDQLAKVPHGE